MSELRMHFRPECLNRVDEIVLFKLEATASLTRLPRRLIAVYFKHGLVSPVMDPACGGWYFNDGAIRILRRIEYLRTACGLNILGISRKFLYKQ
jgi:DNA-binding transcriptional MerR regulator